MRASILAIAAVLCIFGCTRVQRDERVGESQRTIPTRAESGGIESYAAVVERVTPAVVTIRAARRVRQPRQFPFTADPFFEEFFGGRFRGQRSPESRVERGLGSGVVVRDDGYCVTNHHVIDGAQEIRVEFSDGRTVEAKLVGSDPPSDLAVLRIPSSNLKVLLLGDSDQVRVGDIALAIGNPLGIGQTVTAGIISAKGRTTGLSDGSFEDFIQTDAPINRGNSGGALVNTAGRLVGINSQIVSPSGGNIGIGFAIPVNMMKDVLEQLVNGGRVRRGFLGVTIQTITPELALALELSRGEGVLVSDVEKDGPAERAGLRRGDVITKVNGQQTESPNRLRNLVSSLQPGAKVNVTFVRDGNKRDMNVILGELQTAEPVVNETAQGGRGSLGLAVEPLTPQIASQLGIAEAAGVLVREVEPSGPAAEAGLSPGDVILQAGGNAVRTVAALEQQLKSGGTVPLLVNRRGRSFFIAVTPRR